MKVGAILLALTGILHAHSIPNHVRITSAAVQYLFENMSAEDKAKLKDCLPYIEQLLLVGTQREDTDEGNRFMFHFTPELHSPVYGIVQFYIGDHVDAYCSSIQWGLPVGLEYPCVHNQPVDATTHEAISTVQLNEHTWGAALMAARSSDVQTRQQGWRHLGYVLHLLQDLTSPAHVRSDAHPHWPDGWRIHAGDADPIEFDSGRVPSAPLPQLLPLYGSAIEHFGSLATWTQSRFYSRHTVGTVPGPPFVRLSEDGYWLDDEGRKIAALGRRAIIGGATVPSLTPTDATIDDLVADEQWLELGQQAVLYTASLIYEFYKEVGSGPCDDNCNELSGNISTVSGVTIPMFAGLSIGDPFSVRIKIDRTLEKQDQDGTERLYVYYDKADFTADVGGRKFTHSPAFPPAKVAIIITREYFPTPGYTDYLLAELSNYYVPIDSPLDKLNSFSATFEFYGPLASFEPLKAAPFPPALDLLTTKRGIVFVDSMGRINARGEVTFVGSCSAN